MEIDWKQKVLRAVQEVVSHPYGGMVKVFVYTVGVPGRRKVHPIPFLKGKEESEVTIDIEDD